MSAISIQNNEFNAPGWFATAGIIDSAFKKTTEFKELFPENIEFRFDKEN